MKRRSKERIVAMIPARMGSTRLAKKNLALIGGKPLIYYAVDAAKRSGVFDRVVVNSEDEVFGKIAKRYGAHFYQRLPAHATSEARSDAVVYDFIRNNPCDIVVWVNTTSPLQTPGEVRGAVMHFIERGLDSLITVKDEQVHCLYKGKPVNFKIREPFAKTQDLAPVQPFVYSVMIWRSRVFMKEFEKKGYALFCGKFGTYTVSKLAGIIIKREEDLALADRLLRAERLSAVSEVRYDPLAVKSRRKA